MTRILSLCVLYVASGISLGPIWAQVAARTAKPEDLTTQTQAALTEVPSPMLLEVSLGESTLGAKQRKPMNQEQPGPSGGVMRVFTDTARFVCDKAQVQRLLVTLTPKKRQMLDIVISPTLRTEWFRQDIDLTIALVLDGNEVRRKTWDDLTIGRDSAASALGVWGSSHSKSPKAEFEMSRQEFDGLFSDNRAPLVRIIVDIQE